MEAKAFDLAWVLSKELLYSTVFLHTVLPFLTPFILQNSFR